MNINYTCSNGEYFYLKPSVERLMISEFPGSTVTDKETLVDKLTDILIGTRNTRLAGAPNPESLVMIRDIIRSAVEKNMPIPGLVASGPKKNHSGQIDLAELSALQRLACLQRSVSNHYEPGVSLRVRLEDVTGRFIEGDEAIPSMEQYCGDFRKLCNIFNAHVKSEFLLPYCESDFGTVDQLMGLGEEMAPIFVESYKRCDDSMIAALGWFGGISNEWKRFLNDRYLRLYPELDENGRIERACRYLAIILARAKLGLRTGSSIEGWAINGKFIEVNFFPPVPGAPKTSTRVYYRTMSAKQTRLHVPFWRSKGFLRMVGGEVKLGLARGSDLSGNYIPGFVEVSSPDKSKSVIVAADFLESE
jgi:hypothetical protein